MPILVGPRIRSVMASTGKKAYCPRCIGPDAGEVVSLGGT
jgi:hypothetical protein